MRAIVLAFCVLLVAACKSPTGGGGNPPPPPKPQPSTSGSLASSIVAGTELASSISTSNVESCSVSSTSSRGKLQVAGSFTGTMQSGRCDVTMTAAMWVGVDTISIVYSNTQGGNPLKVSYAVQIQKPADPSGPGLKDPPQSAFMGSTLMLTPEVSYASRCSITLEPASVPGGASLELVSQATCPAVRLSMGGVFNPGMVQQVCITAEGYVPENTTLRKCFSIHQMVGEHGALSPNPLVTTAGTEDNVFRSSTCGFLKPVPGVYAGTELSVNGDAFEPLDYRLYIDACSSLMTVSVATRPHDIELRYRNRRPDGSYTPVVTAILRVVEND